MKSQNIVGLNIHLWVFKYLLITHYVQDPVQKIKTEIINTIELVFYSINIIAKHNDIK